MITLPSNTALSLRTATTPSEVFTNIPGVFEFNPGDRAADVIDTTDFDSPNNAEESEAGIIRSSNGSFSFNWEPGNTIQEQIRSGQGTIMVLRSLEADWQSTFSVVIIGVSTPRAVGTKKVCTVTIKLTGDIEEEDLS